MAGYHPGRAFPILVKIDIAVYCRSEPRNMNNEGF